MHKRGGSSHWAKTGWLWLADLGREEGRPVRGEMPCSLLKNEQQKQRQFHGDAEGGAGEASGGGSGIQRGSSRRHGAASDLSETATNRAERRRELQGHGGAIS